MVQVVERLHEVTESTSGNNYSLQFPPTLTQANRDGDRLLEDLKHSLSRTTAFDAVMRVRASTGTPIIATVHLLAVPLFSIPPFLPSIYLSAYLSI